MFLLTDHAFIAICGESSSDDQLLPCIIKFYLSSASLRASAARSVHVEAAAGLSGEAIVSLRVVGVVSDGRHEGFFKAEGSLRL